MCYVTYVSLAHSITQFFIIFCIAHREALNAHGEGHDEDVPAGAEPGHGERDEDEDEEPDEHP